jgi:anti-sigma B factor antagonist
MDDEKPLSRTGAAPVVVTLPAEIDISNADTVGENLAEAFTPGVRLVIADLSATEYCDSSGLRNLARAQAKAAASAAELRLVVQSPAVRHVLDLVGFADLLGIYTSINEAQAPGLRPAAGPVGDRA